MRNITDKISFSALVIAAVAFHVTASVINHFNTQQGFLIEQCRAQRTNFITFSDGSSTHCLGDRKRQNSHLKRKG